MVTLRLAEHVRKPFFVATCQDFRAKSPKRDEGVPQGTSRSDEGFAAEKIGAFAEYGVSGHALSSLKGIFHKRHSSSPLRRGILVVKNKIFFGMASAFLIRRGVYNQA